MGAHVGNHLNPKKVKTFQRSIVKWYVHNGRELPWRTTPEPFRILVAEILLQKTDVEKVRPVYERLLLRWPTPKALSVARFSAISKEIRPLGLKYKAGRLKSVARMIVGKYSGRVPEEEKELLELPGVGRYIASAAQCFAFSKAKAVLDTNVIRIISRVFGVVSHKGRPRDDPRLWEFAQRLVPVDRAKEYNWGLLDYGAAICKSRKPMCRQCVLRCTCVSEPERLE